MLATRPATTRVPLLLYTYRSSSSPSCNDVQPPPLLLATVAKLETAPNASLLPRPLPSCLTRARLDVTSRSFSPLLSRYISAHRVFGRGYEYPFFGEEGKICSEKERIAKIIRIESFRIFRLYRSIFSPERLKCTNTCIYIYMGRAFLPLVFCFSLLRTYPLIRRDTRVHNARYT